jgi:hypothetical protein
LTFIKSIKKIDRSRNIEGQLNEISVFTLAKKEIFNKIHDEYNLKLEKLKNLQKTLKEIEIEDLETRETDRKLMKIRFEVLKNRKNLILESFYTNTLKLMLARLKDKAKKAVVPINQINDKISKATLENKKDSRELKQADFEVTQIDKKIERIKNGIDQEKKEKSECLDHKLKRYEDQQRLKKCMEIEHQRYLALEKNKINTKKLHEFESKISEFKEQTIINKELMKVNRLIENRERSFKAIQKVTKSSNIEDVLPYYIYLKDNQERLEKTLKEYQTLISNLNAQKDSEIEYLNSLKFQTEQIDYSRIERLEALAEGKELQLKEKKKALDMLEKLLLCSLNTLGRITYQFGYIEKAVNFNIETVVNLIACCCVKLEKMIEFIESHQSVYYIESINTDTRYKVHPSFLGLLSGAQNIKRMSSE